MFVCICRQVTDHQIRDLCRNGSHDLEDIRAKLGVASVCGKCSCLAHSIVSEFIKNTPFVNAA
jgi:bacterioferritin-associated ferredoxin